MTQNDQEDQTRYTVVLNDEGQYSIWPVGRPLPLGWSEDGKIGLKSECLDHIEKVWKDMRPNSLRRNMEFAPSK